MGKVSPPKLDWTDQTSDSSDTFDSGHLGGAASLQFDRFSSGNFNPDLLSNSSSNFALYGDGQPFDSGHLGGSAPLQFEPFNSGNLNLDLFSHSSSNLALYGDGQPFDSGHLGGAAPLQFQPINSGNLNLNLFSNSSSNFPLYGGGPSATFTTASLNQGSQSHGGGPGGKAMPTYDQVSADGHLKINLIWDSSVANAPIVNGTNIFQSDVKAAATYLTSQFHDDATLNITVGYGTIAGSRVPATALGESITNLVDHIDPNNQPLTFADLKSHLLSDATKDGWTIDYPASDPTLGGHYWLTTAEAKALGFAFTAQEQLNATNGGVTAQLDVDGHVGFTSFKNIFDYTSTGPTDSVGSGQYDFYATALHEITEVMGRMVFAGTSVNGAANSYEPLDLFRFENGSPDISSTKGGYFSINGGVPPGLHDFNGSGGDYADWASAQVADAFNASGSPGVVETSHGALPDFDLKVMDAIGWDHLV